MGKLAGLLVFATLAACGGDIRNTSICTNEPDRPAECDVTCDPQATLNTCPRGFFCNDEGLCDAVCVEGSDECGSGYYCSPDGRCLVDGACYGLQCDVVDCSTMGMPSTTISGTVYAPNGTLPLYGVSVYVPNRDPGPLEDGVICQQCGELPGLPVAEALSDENGNFTLANVPAGEDIPLVIVSGKWRRRVTVPAVEACTDNAVSVADTRLPATSAEGDIPKIAISTGDADALDCLVRKLGISDSEIATKSQPGRIHLYTNPDSGGQGASEFENGFPGGSGGFANSTTELWNSVDNLTPYDIIILSCEGEQHVPSKPVSALENLRDYADAGGRVFASHWHNVWIAGDDGNPSHGVQEWQDVANFRFGGNPSPDDLTATIDEINNPKGQAFATWMVNVGGSTTRGEVFVNESRTTCESVDPGKAESWVVLDPANAGGNIEESSVMNFQFTTPQSAALADRCGKVVFSDMHVSADSGSFPDTPYPGDCAEDELTPQEKALAFMFFDIASCVSTPVP